jgi:hypothetical protein
MCNLGELWGMTEWVGAVATIYLAFDLGEVQRRCVLWHEIAHVKRGAPCRAMCPGDEADVREETSRFLLPDLDQLADAMGSYPLMEAADRLGVVPDVITDRTDNFTAEEWERYAAKMPVHQAATSRAAGCSNRSRQAVRRTARDRRHSCRRFITATE